MVPGSLDRPAQVWVIGGLALGIPGSLAGLPAMRGLLVMKTVNPFLAVAISKFAMNASLKYVLMVPFGLTGIAFSTALTETITAASLYLLFRRRVCHLSHENLAAVNESSATVSST